MDCRRDLMPSAAGRSRRGRRCGRVLRWRRWKGPPKGCCRAAAAPTNRSHRSTWNSMVADERGADVPRCGGEGARAGSSPIRRQCAKPRRKQAAGDLMVSAHHKKNRSNLGQHTSLEPKHLKPSRGTNAACGWPDKLSRAGGSSPWLRGIGIG